MIHESAIVHEKAKIHPDAKIEPGAVIYEGCIVGKGSVVGANAVLRPDTIIGENTIFGTASVSEGNNYIGNHTTIHAQCHITQLMNIGDRVFIAPFFCQANTPMLLQGEKIDYGIPQNYPHTKKEGEICEGVVIGVGVIVAPGVIIEKYSKIDMCAYITKNVPEYSHVRSGKDIVGRIVGDTTELSSWYM